jgi:Na+-translocating ferredoxin:NAD+ oxidoreductase RnfD subunit
MSALRSLDAGLRRDPRLYQIAILATLLVYGAAFLDFEVRPLHAITIPAAALLAQAALTRLARLPRFDPRSALISSLSLCLLLRTNALSIAILAAVVTIASKFVFRVDGKHVFNPTNFGLVATMLLTGQAWVSPGQWGNAAFFAFLLACLGGLVVNRAARSDVTFAFIAFYVLILGGRALWLDDPLSIPLHQLRSGAFLIFAFLMISDPKTTPNSRAGRILFASLVAMGAAFVQFGLYRTNGLLWSLAIFAMTVPLIDRLFPGNRYQWKDAAAPSRPSHRGDSHETIVAHHVPVPLHPASRTPRRGLLRLLRGKGGVRPVQQGLPGGPRPAR